MRKILCAVLKTGLLLATQTAGFAAPPVEGFLGVPWGADRQQVDAAMADRVLSRCRSRTGAYQ